MASGGRKRAVPVEDEEFEEQVESPKRRAPNSVARGRGGRAQSQRGSQSAKKSESTARSAMAPLTPPKDAAYIDLSVAGKPKKLIVPCHEFPRFHRAEVSIRIARKKEYNYQLHSDILAKHSAWFKETLEQDIQEFDEPLAAEIHKTLGLAHRYELEHDPVNGRWLLIKTNLTIPNDVELEEVPISNPSTFNTESTAAASSPQNGNASKPHDIETTRVSKDIAGHENNGDNSGIKKEVVQESGIIKQEDEETKIAKDKDFEASSKATTTDIPKPTTNSLADDKTANTKDIITHNPADQEDAKIFQAYNNLFLVYYDKTPGIDASNIEKALGQSELLLNIARHYGSLPAVRVRINDAMMLYSRELPKAIQKDPPRWLFFSIMLHSALIFKEAVIHIVGSLPHWPSTIAPRTKFAPDLLKLLDKKADDLKVMKLKIDESLFMSTILVDGKEVRLNKANKSVIDTWVTVQLWRDWFCRSLNRAKASRDVKNIDARMYRIMAKGDDAYLSFDDVRTSLEEFNVTSLDYAQWDSSDLKNELNILKEYAKKEVQSLVVNNSMVAVEEEGIEYFTCIKVENDELPWVKKAATPAP